MDHYKWCHESSQVTINHHKFTMTWIPTNHKSLQITTNHDMNYHDDPKRALHKAIWLPCWNMSQLQGFLSIFQKMGGLRKSEFSQWRSDHYPLISLVLGRQVPRLHHFDSQSKTLYFPALILIWLVCRWGCLITNSIIFFWAQTSTFLLLWAPR